nr:helix-turn-helix domain-containing protein [uncultured Lichenicoccus sp.]
MNATLERPRPRLMTVSAAAELIGMHPETLRRAIRKGELTCYRRKGCTRIAPEHLQEFLDKDLCLAKGSTSLTLRSDGDLGLSSGGSEGSVTAFRRGQRLKAALDKPSRISSSS